MVPFRKLRTVLHCRIEHSMRVGLCVCLFVLLWYANSPTRSGMVQFIGRNCRGQGIWGTGCLTRWVTSCSAMYTNDHVSGLHNDCSNTCHLLRLRTSPYPRPNTIRAIHNHVPLRQEK